MYQKENWIDFESEISKVIKSIDNDMHEKDFNERIDMLSNEYLMERYRYYNITYDDLFVKIGEEEDTRLKLSFGELRDILYKDLCKLIRALEIYLCEYVEKIEIQKKSPDINNLEIDKILSFNYTNIFSQLYKKATCTEDDRDAFDYIHGKANISNTIEINNMVLGIGEYLSDERKDKNIDFIAFKKFYQRIYKQTGCKYKEWVDKIKMDKREVDDYFAIDSDSQRSLDKYRYKNKCHNLYIFGHSLDITDKDILRELILNDNVYTTIFYHDKDTMGQQIANLVKVIGQDELIRRTWKYEDDRI